MKCPVCRSKIEIIETSFDEFIPRCSNSDCLLSKLKELYSYRHDAEKALAPKTELIEDERVNEDDLECLKDIHKKIQSRQYNLAKFSLGAFIYSRKTELPQKKN